jgi:uncharacterized radical SAM protein YgiQ
MLINLITIFAPMNNRNINSWLPTTAKEVKERGWDDIDVILFSADAYVDHPSFGGAVIGRVLEAEGLKVAIVPQPNWRDDLRDFKKLGKPNLFFAISAGSMDSMINHYTAAKRKRSDDAYTPDGKSGMRPDRPTIVYTKILKELFPDSPVVIGGIESSLRRLTHYDYWDDELKTSILAESGADMLIYGMGEKPIRQLSTLLKKGIPFETLTNIQQTSVLCEDYKTCPGKKKWKEIILSSHEDCLKDKKKFAKNFRYIEEESNSYDAARIIQQIGDKFIVVNPQFNTLSTKELDKIYALPFTRLPHPKYKNKHIPAYEMIRHSITMHRGCFGGCAFCTISAHQGKLIASRSEKSIIEEVEKVAQMDDFKGYISDLGGPSANMYGMYGKDISICKKCKRASCIFPNICFNLNTDHSKLTEVYKKASMVEGVKKAFVGSGIRYDLVLHDTKDKTVNANNSRYLEQLINKHVSGRLKVAPEHTSEDVLKMMRKPSFSLFKRLNKLFIDINKKFQLKQQLIPYFISSHPGSKNVDMADLAIETKALDFKLEQIQDFTPTPMTLATVMYYSGYHPYSLNKIYTAKSRDEKEMQRKFFFWYKKEERKDLIHELTRLGKKDWVERLLGK